jgi:putative glycosyltransferase (TIGR04372 family)
MNYIKKILSNLIYIFIYIIFRIYKIKLLNSDLSAIGHQCFDLECFKIDYKKEKFKPIILYDLLQNKVLFDYFQDNGNFCIIKNKLICKILNFYRRCKNISFDTLKYISRDESRAYKKFYKFSPYIKDKFNNEEFKECIYYLKKHKFDHKKNFVVFHARDSSFKLDGESYRNADIDSFELCADFFIKKKYNVVRIGNYGMKKCKFSNKILDLTLFYNKISQNMKEKLDLFLIAHAKFFIGSCSGVYNIATLFDVPVLQTNAAPLAHVFPNARIGIGIPKLYKFKSLNFFLNIKTIIHSRAAFLRYDEQFKNLNIELVDNSPKDILNASKELMDYANLKSSIIIKKKHLQKKFKKFLFCKTLYSYDSRSVISNSFVKKNLFLFS